MASDLDTRRARYYELSTRLAHVDDNVLKTILGAMGPQHGWGGTHVLRLGSSKVFMKKIPITQIEYDRLYSTENLYGMPAFYNYGVGSAGFGGFREIVANVKSTNWVLEGSIENFPLLYHYRIIPRADAPAELDEERHKGYVSYWASDPNIDRYIRERHAAKYEAVLFLEHIPTIMGEWMGKHPGQWESVIKEMRKTIAFMRDRGMIHFDVHFWNILIDEERPYLTDFGLVTDLNFSLSKEEKAFFRRHTDYDDAEFLSGVGSFIYSLYKSLPSRRKKTVMRKYGLDADTSYNQLVPLLLERIEEIHAENLIALDDQYVAQVIRHRELMLLMHNFYSKLRNPKKDTPYPQGKIRRLLAEASSP